MWRSQSRSGTDSHWLWISAALTAGFGVAALSLMRALPFSGLPDPVVSLASWLGWTLFACGFSVIFYTLRLLRGGVEHPLRILAAKWKSAKAKYIIIVAGMLLAGLDMYFYMIAKPELNLLFPFWADPHLANLDSLMLGRDPWRFFASWDLELVSWFYTPIWFLGVLLTFYWLLLKPPSQAKSAAIVAYFLTWTVFGTIGQALLSSGGPIFYARLGLGNRFASIAIPELESRISDYLWSSYAHHSLVPGAGISAMPSLHVASMTWMVLAYAGFRSRLTIPSFAATLFIYAASVALGWHYLSDGLAGAAGAALCYGAAYYYFSRSEQPQLSPVAV